MKVASAGPSQIAPPVTSSIRAARRRRRNLRRGRRQGRLINKPEVASQPEAARAESPGPSCRRSRPAIGTGNGILGVLPAATAAAPAPAATQALAVTPTRRRSRSSRAPPASRVAAHTGWIVQVGALESESEAQQRIDAARSSGPRPAQQGRSVHRAGRRQGQRKLYRARFAGLDRDQAEAVCRTLKRADISCITVRN